MPELPEVHALVTDLRGRLVGRTIKRFDVVSFAALKTFDPPVSALEGRTVDEIFGHPDDLKFRSSMTLFADVAPDEAVFQACIDKFFGGEPDDETLARL